MTGITTWSLRLMCELCEYVRRTGDTALRDRFADRVAAFVDGAGVSLGRADCWNVCLAVHRLVGVQLRRIPDAHLGSRQCAVCVYAGCARQAVYPFRLVRGERMRGILRAAVLDGRLPETVRTIPDSLERHPDGRLHGRGRCSETGIATCLWADLFAPGELPALDAAFRDCMGFSPRFAPDPEIGRSQLFIGLCIRLDALARRGCYDRLYGSSTPSICHSSGRDRVRYGRSVCMENSSRCHGFTSHAGVHLVRDVLGLGEPDGLDRTLTVAPHPCGLRWARGHGSSGGRGGGLVAVRRGQLFHVLPDTGRIRGSHLPAPRSRDAGARRVHITVNGREIR